MPTVCKPLSLLHHGILILYECFFCDDAYHKLGSLRAIYTVVSFNNSKIYAEDLASTKH